MELFAVRLVALSRSYMYISVIWTNKAAKTQWTTWRRQPASERAPKASGGHRITIAMLCKWSGERLWRKNAIYPTDKTKEEEKIHTHTCRLGGQEGGGVCYMSFCKIFLSSTSVSSCCCWTRTLAPNNTERDRKGGGEGLETACWVLCVVIMDFDGGKN